jgi:hypothetical protein
MALFLIFEKIILLKMGFDSIGGSLETTGSARRGRFHRLGQEASADGFSAGSSAALSAGCFPSTMDREASDRPGHAFSEFGRGAAGISST